MNSLIEQAARRLELLRQAGVETVRDTRPLVRAKGRVATDAPTLAEADLPWNPRQQRPLPPNPTEEAARGGLTGRHSHYVELDLRALAAAGLGHVPGSRLTDELRVIKRPLLRNFMGKGAAPVPNGNLIMVTSALPGEGKSFTAINLALSIAAEINHTVMLVDADVVRPSILQMLGLQPRAGLLDVLQDESVELSDVLLRTNVEKLAILPGGTPCARATELLASDAMTALLDEMANRYPDRILVFDSPPLLLTTESHVLASHMGQIAMVVNVEHTLQRDLRQALVAIESCPVKMMVLNRVRTTSPVGYGYGYGQQDR